MTTFGSQQAVQSDVNKIFLGVGFLVRFQKLVALAWPENETVGEEERRSQAIR